MDDVELNQIAELMRFVNSTALSRMPWLANTREPTEAEMDHMRVACAKHSVLGEDEIADDTPTKVLF